MIGNHLDRAAEDVLPKMRNRLNQCQTFLLDGGVTRFRVVENHTPISHNAHLALVVRLTQHSASPYTTRIDMDLIGFVWIRIAEDRCGSKPPLEKLKGTFSFFSPHEFTLLLGERIQRTRYHREILDETPIEIGDT